MFPKPLANAQARRDLGQRQGCESTSLLTHRVLGTEDGAQEPGQKQGDQQVGYCTSPGERRRGLGWERTGEVSVWALIWGRALLCAASDPGVRRTACSLVDYGFLMVSSSSLTAIPATATTLRALLPTPPRRQLLFLGAGTPERLCQPGQGVMFHFSLCSVSHD